MAAQVFISPFCATGVPAMVFCIGAAIFVLECIPSIVWSQYIVQWLLNNTTV